MISSTIRTVVPIVLGTVLLTACAAPTAPTTQSPAAEPQAASEVSITDSTTAAIPAGLQPVSFHGVQVLVPASWKVNDEHCGTPLTDTVLIENGFVAACGMPQPSGLTVVRLAPLESPLAQSRASIATEPVTVDGRQGKRGVGTPTGESTQLAVVVLPEPGVVISVESPDPARADQLLDTVVVTPVDAVGCRDVRPTVGPDPTDPAHGPELAESLVPISATAASICRYSDNRLARSAALASDDIDQLSRILNDLPTGVSHPAEEPSQSPEMCAEDARRGFVVQFAGAAKPDSADLGSADREVAVEVVIGGCADLYASNGNRTTTINYPLVLFLTDRAGYDGGIPDPRTLR